MREGRFAEAEPLLKAVLENHERKMGKEALDTLISLAALANLYSAEGRFAEAEPLHKRVLAGMEGITGKDNPDTNLAVSNLANTYFGQRRYAEAEQLYKRVLETNEHAIGKENPQTLIALHILANLYVQQNRLAEAEPLLKRALDARERVLGKEYPDTLWSVGSLGAFYFAQHDWVRAAEFWRRYIGAVDIRGKRKAEAEGPRVEFRKSIKAVYRLTPEGRAPDAASTRQTFETAQWALSSDAAASLAQMAARGANGDPRLAILARERQDLVGEWQKRDELRNATLGQTADKRNAKAEAENQARLGAIDIRVAAIDKDLAEKFPDYAALASPASLPLEQVQGQLGVNEALVLLLDTPELKPAPEETFVWVVTKTDMRWVQASTRLC